MRDLLCSLLVILSTLNQSLAFSSDSLTSLRPMAALQSQKVQDIELRDGIDLRTPNPVRAPTKDRELRLQVGTPYSYVTILGKRDSSFAILPLTSSGYLRCR